MEIKINREIRDYKENIFFGLSLRQLIFSLLACGVAVGIYLGLRDALGTETVSWLCILGAAPFAAMGFVKYHGMTAEKFFIAWLRSEFLVPKRLTFRPTNLYWEAMQEQRRQEKKHSTLVHLPRSLQRHMEQKGGAARNAEKVKRAASQGPGAVPYSPQRAGGDPHPHSLEKRYLPCGTEPVQPHMAVFRHQLCAGR